ncbi:hypothetical protein AOLI_G00314880 [Acnodon oligacanthus]
MPSCSASGATSEYLVYTRENGCPKLQTEGTSDEKELLVRADDSASSSCDGRLKESQAPIQNVYPRDDTLCGNCFKSDEEPQRPSRTRAAHGRNRHKRFKSSSAQALSDADEDEGPVPSDKTSPEKNEGKQLMCLSLNACELTEGKFWPPKLEDTFTLSVKSDRLSLHVSDAKDDSNTTNTFTLPDGNEVCISWDKDQAIQEIMRLANLGHESTQDDIVEEITDAESLIPGSSMNIFKNTGFQQYARTVYSLMHRKQEQQQEDCLLQFGKYVLRLQNKDLYVIPQYEYTDGHLQTMRFNDRNLSYAKISPTNRFNKKYTETLYNYIIGNHRKVDRFVQSPEDAIAIGAVLFSEVIRNPEMFLHNFVLIHLLKSWDDFHHHHPMVTGGSWKHQGNNENLPKKVIEKTRSNYKAFMQRFFSGNRVHAIAG